MNDKTPEQLQEAEQLTQAFQSFQDFEATLTLEQVKEIRRNLVGIEKRLFKIGKEAEK